MSSRSDTSGSGSDDTDSRSSDDFTDGEAETTETKSNDIDLKSFAFCKTHVPGQMDRTCNQCSIALTVINSPSLVSRLFGESASNSSDLQSRFGKRCDDVIPTMNLDDDTMKTVVQMFSRGQFNSKTIWNDIIKKHLTLPKVKHDLLTDDLKNEEMFNHLRNDGAHKSVFRYQGEIRDCLKNYRLASRPIFSLVQILNNQLSDVRKFGLKIGIKYPDVPPGRSGVNVPRDAGPVPDNLEIKSAEDVLPCPDMQDLFDSLQLQHDDKLKIVEAMEQYRVSVGTQIVKFYQSISSALNNMDDLLIFHFHLLGHCDASMRDVLRNKILSLFKPDVKKEILSSLKNQGKPAGGSLCGGDKNIRSTITDATANEAVLKKAIRAKKKTNRSAKKHRDWSPAPPRSRGRSRLRSPPSSRRSRSGDYKKSSGSGSGSSYKNRKRKSSKSGGGSSSKKSKSDNHKE